MRIVGLMSLKDRGVLMKGCVLDTSMDSAGHVEVHTEGLATTNKLPQMS